MPTQDYTTVAAAYKAFFSTQNRSGSSAEVSANEQFDRDNLLHYLEENFKTNGGGVSLEKFRALMHTLIKSVKVQKDDFSVDVLLSRACRIASASTSRNYFPSSYYGYLYNYWSTFESGDLSDTTLPTVSAAYGNSFPETPFELWDLQGKGYIQNSSSTGEVTITMYYCDPDDATNGNFQNVVYVGADTVDCVITDTDYAWNIQGSGRIPSNKKILTFVRNDGWTASTETLYFSQTLTYSKHNASYTQS
jgi:hypothetical protein